MKAGGQELGVDMTPKARYPRLSRFVSLVVVVLTLLLMQPQTVVVARLAAPSSGNRSQELRPIMRCTFDGEEVYCTIKIYVEAELPEEVLEWERIDITPGGWGIDTRLGNCQDCMTPLGFPQHTDPPPEPIDDGPTLCSGTTEWDMRDWMRWEYPIWSTVAAPSCSDFATTGGNTDFPWSTLSFYPGNYGHLPWAVIHPSLPGNLSATKTAYQHSITVSSGYRCPGGNLLVGGSMGSRHVVGDAVDVYGQVSTWDLEAFNELRDRALANGFTFNLSYTQYADRHLHIDMR